jgi:GNAT superfamily N-acetyltransferase
VVDVNGLPVVFITMRDDFIDDLYIDPDYWRHGIGHALLVHAKLLSPGHL